MHTTVQPHSYVALELPSGTIKLERIIPNTYVTVSKLLTLYCFARAQLMVS